MAENIIEFEHTVSEILKVYMGGGRLAKRKNLHTKWPDDNDLDKHTAHNQSRVTFN